jgi:hypothetical protein
MAPSDTALEMFKPGLVGDRRRRAPRADAENAYTNATPGPSLTLSEFGRLVCILLESGLDQTRAQSDRREGRDEFWPQSVEPAFNNPATLVSLSVAGAMAELDVNAAQRAYRGGERLKSYFFKARGLFTQIYERWSVSDPKKFVDFLPRAPRSSETSTEGKRAHILFIAMQCGNPDEDADALNFTKRTAPEGVGFDDLDSDSSGDRGNVARPAKRLRATE